MNRIERLTAILLLLQDKPHTSDEIARRFEVSRRTVLRDVQALCEIGVPIVAREGVGGGYSLPTNYQLAPLPLSVQEAFLLLLAIDSISRLSDTPFAPQRASLLAKLRAVLPSEHLPNVEHMLAAVSVDVPQRSEQAPWLETLMAAAQAGEWLEVTYQSAERLSVQHVLPRQISAQNGYWYCRAFAHEHGEERLYRVDRIRAVAVPDPQFVPAPVSEPLPYDHESHPQIVVTLTPRGVAIAESEPHISSHILRQADGMGSMVFRCPPGELDWFARYFASLGADAQICAPQELRTRLAQIGQHLVKQYE